MTVAHLRYCSVPGCPARVPRGRCALHDRRTPSRGWQGQHGQTPNRIRGPRLQALREQLFAREPFCRLCPEPKRLADIRDHIIPLAEGGTENPENIQPLCTECSLAKSQQEAKRGAARFR